MDWSAQFISYAETGYFSPIVIDYLNQSEKLRPFYNHPPTIDGVREIIEERKSFHVNRELLVSVLKKQYKGVLLNDKVSSNLDLLLDEKTFTVTTAHQPNIFTGPLYFIYKILHAVKLADDLKNKFPGNHFVPVYFMGSEDADIDELGHIYLDGEKLEWKTRQSGAVGRMKVDKELLKMISTIEGRAGVLPYSNEIIQLIREAYQEGESIQNATLKFVNALFGEYGVIVIIPDDKELKQAFSSIIHRELFEQFSDPLVDEGIKGLAKNYKVQVNAREINLFYLADHKRERIELNDDGIYQVLNTDISFSREQMEREIADHPECFSPNVILRGVFQEMILPNIAFIGGGGELAYWLEFRNLYKHLEIPFPVLILRNSFLLAEKKWIDKALQLGFEIKDFFKAEDELINELVQKESSRQVKLNGTFTETEKIYEAIKEKVADVDTTLMGHVESLKTQSLYKLKELEKKMLRAEKRKYEAQHRQIKKVRSALFPNGLQERTENLITWYAGYGKEWIQCIYENMGSLDQQFCILSEKK